MLTAQEIESYLHREIPLTLAMGVRVFSHDEGELTLEAPLAANHNHLGTAFGGSLNALATLAGYALIWSSLDDPSCHVVIRESAITFDRPVRTDLRAVCRQPDPAVWAQFKSDFARKKKARIELDVTIEDEEGPAVEFTGTFVALK
jgi:thioesterase domain-containing protein